MKENFSESIWYAEVEKHLKPGNQLFMEQMVKGEKPDVFIMHHELQNQIAGVQLAKSTMELGKVY